MRLWLSTLLREEAELPGDKIASTSSAARSLRSMIPRLASACPRAEKLHPHWSFPTHLKMRQAFETAQKLENQKVPQGTFVLSASTEWADGRLRAPRPAPAAPHELRCLTCRSRTSRVKNGRGDGRPGFKFRDWSCQKLSSSVTLPIPSSTHGRRSKYDCLLQPLSKDVFWQHFSHASLDYLPYPLTQSTASW